MQNCCFGFSLQKHFCDEGTVYTGIKPRVEVAQHRFTQTTESDVVPPPEADAECHLCVVAQPNGMGRSQMNEPTELYACLYASEFPTQALLRLPARAE